MMKALLRTSHSEQVLSNPGTRLQLLLMVLYWGVCQVGEVCGGGDGDGVERRLGHGGLWASGGALSRHQHHGRVGGRRVVRGHDPRLHMGLLHVGHVVGVVAVLDLRRMDVDGLLGRGEGGLGGLRVGPRGHGGRGGGQSRVHLLLWGLVGQVQGLCCCGRRCSLWVLGVLHWAGGGVVGGSAVLGRSTLLALSRGRGRGLGVLRMGVQGGAVVRVLLRHGAWRHIHGVCLLRVLRAGGLSVSGRGHHPGAALHHRTEDVLRLGLVVGHLLHQGLTGELLRAAEVLGRVGGARGHNGRSCRCG